MKKGYLKSLTTKEQFQEEFRKAISNNLNTAKALAVARVAFSKGIILEEVETVLGLNLAND